MNKNTLVLLVSVMILNSAFSQKPFVDTLKVCTEIKELNESGEKIAALKREKWQPGQTLRVRFIDGSDFVQSKVKQFATEWSNHCSIKFTFVNSGPAEIRISFLTGKGSWSIIGKSSAKYSVNPNTGNIYLSNTGITMNYGWFDSYTPDEEFSRTVIHEFGHAIGLIHEHQSPVAEISWNKPVVYAYYFETMGWSKAEVDRNIFTKYSKSESQYSKYDKLSIMHYPIPASHLLKPNQAVGWNNVLSTTDKSFIGFVYPSSNNKRQKKKRERGDAHAGDIHGGVH